MFSSLPPSSAGRSVTRHIVERTGRSGVRQLLVSTRRHRGSPRQNAWSRSLSATPTSLCRGGRQWEVSSFPRCNTHSSKYTQTATHKKKKFKIKVILQNEQNVFVKLFIFISLELDSYCQTVKMIIDSITAHCSGLQTWSSSTSSFRPVREEPRWSSPTWSTSWPGS